MCWESVRNVHDLLQKVGVVMGPLPFLFLVLFCCRTRCEGNPLLAEDDPRSRTRLRSTMCNAGSLATALRCWNPSLTRKRRTASAALLIAGRGISLPWHYVLVPDSSGSQAILALML